MLSPPAWTWLKWGALEAFLTLVGGLLAGSSRYRDWYLAGALLAPAIGVCLSVFSPEWRVRLVALSIAAFFVVGLWFSSLGPERNELESEGGGFVAALAQYQAVNGHFPASLSEAGCSPHWNRFGGWQYEALAQGTSYHLWVGDYEEDDFILYRYAKDARWSWDT